MKNWQIMCCAMLLASGAQAQNVSAPVEPGVWMKGDLHLHSRHSKDSTNNGVGKIIRFAEDESFDFLAITDHDSHVDGDTAHPYDQKLPRSMSDARDVRLIPLRKSMGVHMSANHPTNKDHFGFSFAMVDSIEVNDRMGFLKAASFAVIHHNPQKSAIFAIPCHDCFTVVRLRTPVYI